MEGLELLVSDFKNIPENEKQFSEAAVDIAKANICLFAKLFGIKTREDIYRKLKYNSHDIDAETYRKVSPLYELHQNIWEKKYYLIHHLNIIRVHQGLRGLQPIADNSFVISELGEVVPSAKKVSRENGHLKLDGNHQHLLNVSVVNYYLRQIGLPSVAGGHIIDCGLNEDAVELDIREALQKWLERPQNLVRK